MRLKTTGLDPVSGGAALRRAPRLGAGLPGPYQRHRHRQHRRRAAGRHGHGDEPGAHPAPGPGDRRRRRRTASWHCRPGVYAVDFELTGFQNVKREGIRVVINQTLSVDQQLQVATLQETRHGHRRIARRRHDDDDDGHQLHQGTAHRDPQRPRRLGGDGAGAGHADDRLRRRRLAHRQPDRLSRLRDGRPEPDPARGHRHHRSHQRQRRLLRLRQLRGVPGRRRRRGRLGLRRRRGAQHQRQVGQRSLLGQLVQRLPERGHDRQQRPRLPAGRQPEERGRLLHPHAARARQPDPEAVRPQRQRRRADLARQDLGLLQLPAEQPVQVHHRAAQQHRAVEADQPVHLQAHLPDDAEQSAGRLHQQAPEAAGQARHQRDHAALGRLLPVVGEHADEGRVDQRARQPRVPRRDGRQLVELLPAAPGQRLRPLRRTVGPGAGQPGQQPDLRRRRQQRLPGPEALEAAGLRQPVVLQGRLGRQPRLQGRLRPEARPPQPVPRPAVRHVLPRQRRRAVADRHLQHRRHRHQRRRQPGDLAQRHLEAHQPPHGEPGPALRALQG